MKARIAVATLALGLVMVGGCGATVQGPAPGVTQAAPSYRPSPAADPVAAVNAYLDAYFAKRFGALPGLVCAARRASVAELYDPEAQTNVPPEASRGLLDALVVGLTDRSVALVSSTAEAATVKLGGTMTWRIGDDALRAYIAAVAAGASPSPSPDELEQAFQMVKASIATQVLASEVPVVAEGGGWLICADIVTTRPGSPAPSPVG
jgi:hypothetical protein